jgi:type IV secretory pathway TraG/TraD family ATPase VirD4
MSGIFYDYKDFELTEYVNFFYTKSDIPVYTISPARPEYSHRVNPIDPKYIETFADVNTITSTFIQNLAAATKEKFFHGSSRIRFVCGDLENQRTVS